MIELDDHLRAVRAHARTWGAQLRSIADEVAADADAVCRLSSVPVLDYLATARFSPAGRPLRLGGRPVHLDTVLDQVVFFEELAYGDVGALMAAPGAPLIGPLVETLGDQEQREAFFNRLDLRPTWTFFALTEPDRGSDATALTTRLIQTDHGYTLHGAKKFVGNASRAQIGAVFARLHPGPLGLRAVLVDASSPGFRATPLATVGLRGALVGEIRLDGVPVRPDQLLGGHLPPTRRGAWGWTQVFNRLRPRVAAMALGLARAAYDYVTAHRSTLRVDERARLDDLADRIGGVQQLVRRCAVAVDRDPADGHLASAAKIRAARLAERVTLTAVELLGPGSRLDHPILDRLARDARGPEFMEGAGNVQKLSVASHLIQGRNHHG